MLRALDPYMFVTPPDTSGQGRSTPEGYVVQIRMVLR